MSRLGAYFTIAAATLLGAFIVAFSNVSTPAKVPVAALSDASSTVSVVSNPASPEVSLPDQVLGTSTVTPIESPKNINEPVPVSTTPAQSVALNSSAESTRSALVNIICYTAVNSGLRSISASGIFIDAKGIILTNAHVAQYFLLADRGVSCVIRSGSPATESYYATLIYISPLWLSTNPTVITQSAPIGTGEYDFALLAVTKSASGGSLPASFPSIPLATASPEPGTSVVIASYGAQYLQTQQIQSDLYPTIVLGSVKGVFTFAIDSVDVLALGSSAAAQEGSSGGGVIDANGELVGTLTTASVHKLNAITSSYIRREYADETGRSLDSLLSQPISSAIAGFAYRLSPLESILTSHLP